MPKIPLVPLLANIFNRATCKGFPTSWTKHTIVLIFKSVYHMISRNYKTLMIRHYLTKPYGANLELELSLWVQRNVSHSARQEGSLKGFMTLIHILTLQALNESINRNPDNLYTVCLDHVHT